MGEMGPFLRLRIHIFSLFYHLPSGYCIVVTQRLFVLANRVTLMLSRRNIHVSLSVSKANLQVK
jgi:hypothetical protein